MQYEDFEYQLTFRQEIRLIKYQGYASYVYIPDMINNYKVTIIAGDCFEDNDIVKHIRFPKTLKKIERNAIHDCSKLAELYFPNTDLRIQSLAVWKCFSLRRVMIPQNVKYIGVPAFMGCFKLDMIMVDENNERYIAIDDVLYEKNPLVLLKYPEGKMDKKYIMPRIHKIADYGLSFNNQLKRVLLPKTLNDIGYGAFYDSGIEKITIPDSVDVLGEAAFCQCTQLEKIALSNNIKRIDCDTFEKCKKLHSITIPQSVKTLDCMAFKDCCNDLIIKVHSDCYLTNKNRIQLNFEIEEK